MNIGSAGNAQSSSLIFLFRSLLHFALFLTITFSIYNYQLGLYQKVLVEAVMSLCFLLCIVMLYRKLFIKQILFIAMFVSVAGAIVMMMNHLEVAYWAPVLVVVAFGLFGTRWGSYWSVLINLAITSLLIMDQYSQLPVYSHYMVINIIISYAVISLIACFFFIKLEEQNISLVKETAKREKLEMAEVLAGGIAHLVNNEMQSIVGRVSLINMEASPALSKQVKKIEATAFRASEHVTQLLAYAGGGKYNSIYFDVEELLSLLIKQRINVSDSEKEITFNLSMSPSLYYCDGDPRQIRQVIDNLLDNAIEASDCSGEILIMLENDYRESETDGMTPGFYVKISIRDMGKGIAKESLDRIFDPFYSTRFIGRGLGLAAVYGIVKNHLGHINVNSEESLGTTFQVWLPVKL
ncbi:MAG: ATP-binding protein [Mariprofundaceae bacterium]